MSYLQGCNFVMEALKSIFSLKIPNQPSTSLLIARSEEEAIYS